MDALPSVDEDFPDTHEASTPAPEAPTAQGGSQIPLHGISPYAIGIQKYWEGQYKLPSVDDDFGPDDPPSWAARADSAMQNSVLRIQNAFGTGVKAGFGEAPLETYSNVFSKENIDAAKKAGWWNDYSKGEANFYKSMFEGTMRSSAVALTVGMRTAQGLISGAAETLGQIAEETGLTKPGTQTGEQGLRMLATDPSTLFALSGAEIALAPFTFGITGATGLLTAALGAARKAKLGEAAEAASKEAEAAMAAERAAAPPFGKRTVPPSVGEALPTPAEETQNVFLRPQPEEEVPRAAPELPSAQAPIVLPIMGEDSRLALEEAALKKQDLELAQQQRGLARGGQPAVDKLAQLSAVERNLADGNITAEQRKALSQRRDELLADTTPEKLKAEAAPIEQRRVIQAQRDSIAQQLQGIGEKLAKSRLSQALQNAANLHIDLDAARAHGVLAEGEAGYYDLKPPTPENTRTREDAAKSAGIPPPTPEPPPKDAEELARRIAPDAFKRSDEIAAQRAVFNRDLARLPEDAPEAETVLNKLSALDEEEAKLDDDIQGAYKQADNLMPDQKTLDELVKAQEKIGPFITPPVENPQLEVTRLQLETDEQRAAKLTAGEVPGLPPRGLPETFNPREDAAAFQKQIDTQLNPPETAPIAEPTAAPKTRTTTSIRPVEGTGEAQTRTLAQGIEDKAVASKLTESFGDLPEYRQVSMEDQAARAHDLIEADYENAKAIAMGEKQPPKGVLPESVLVAVEKHALAIGDAETLRQLATESKLSTAATTMGQRIRTLRERDPESPIGAIQAVQKAREAALAKHGGELEKAAAAVRSNAGSQSSWEGFINAITCAED